MKAYKVLLWILVSLLVIFISTYFFIVPAFVSNDKIINYVCEKINQNSTFAVSIQKPFLRTYPNSDIKFGVDKLIITKDNSEILLVKDFDTEFSLRGIFNKKIYINKLSLDSILVDADKLLTLLGGEKENNEKTFDWKFDLYDSILSLNKAHITYSPATKVYLTLNANKLYVDNTQKDLRHIHFDITSQIQKENEVIEFAISDKNKVFIKNKHLYFDNCIFDINKSKIAINIDGSRKNGLNVNLSSNNFRIEDIAEIISTNLIISNGSEILSYLKDLNGNFDFNINLNKDILTGKVNLNKADMQIVPLNNLPLKISKGTLELTPKNIILKDFDGFYGKTPSNKVAIEGEVKDYTKSCDTTITIKTVANNEFAKNYLSPLTGVPLEIVGNAGTMIILKSVYDKIDITAMSKLSKGEDILIDGASLTPTDYDRAVKADMHIRKNLLNIENINYYIASELKKGVKVQPVVTLRGQLDISKPTPEILAFGFEVPNPLPSEFLNVLVGQKLFKGGKFDGKLYYVYKDKDPEIKGKLNAEKIRIPSQRLYIKQATLFTNDKTIHIISNGKFKRANFTFKGDIKSTVKYPIVIKNMDFELDKLDVEKLLNSFNQQPQTDIEQNNSLNSEDENDSTVTFDSNNLLIENCVFKLKAGSYKDIKFGNLNANLTLDKNNILELHSNKFDIAEGISTVKVLCDLNNHKYYLRLGIKDVNSDLMSTTLLNLPREISGKASGLIELNTDDSLKMNGIIKFAIKDGQIQKIGLVEYLMKFASIFRNPIVMISPSIISDIINIPEGKFEKINGELNIENNFVKLIKIKSTSPQLSTYIVGCYNIETSDAILRIYTKFSTKRKGFGGFLRNISLNSLANRIPLSSKNDSNYYAAELKHLPEIDADEKDCQIFLTTVDGDLEHNNFLSALKKIK